MSEMKKILIAIGGLGSEFPVSLSSGRYVFENFPVDQFEPIILLMLPDGRMGLMRDLHLLKGEGNLLNLAENWEKSLPSIYEVGQWYEMLKNASIKPDLIHGALLMIHGRGGEDGLLPSFFELQNIPYAGFDSKASQICFDKHLCKLIWRDRGWLIADFCLAYEKQGIIGRSEFEELYPLSQGWCVKPSREGSSVGVSMVFDEIELSHALENGYVYDTKLVIEPMLKNFRELEVAVIEINGKWCSSSVGEIYNNPSEYYDFESKYGANSTKTGLARLSDNMTTKIKELALDVVQSIEGRGFARVDFFLSDKQDVYINEVNSLPGFTGISMFPWLWQQDGLCSSQLINNLIEGIRPNGQRN